MLLTKNIRFSCDNEEDRSHGTALAGPQVAIRKLTEYKGNIQYAELQDATDCSCDWKQAQGKGGTL